MIRLIYFLAFIVTSSALPACRDNWDAQYDKDVIAFNDWADQHDKDYSCVEETKYKFDVWRDNMRYIEAHDADEKGYELGMNHLGDQLWPTRCNGMRNSVMDSTVLQEPIIILGPPGDEGRQMWPLPASVDWREKGVVTHIKNQMQCGSCWAFSAVGSMEGQHALKSGELRNLSESQIVDCDVNASDQGCNGGWMDGAFKYAIKEGMEAERYYPYEPVDANCTYDKSDVVANFTGFKDVVGGESGLEEAVATIGPISVAIDAGTADFQFYKSGVFYSKDCSPTMLDHGVLVVGYGTMEKGGDYWIVKNSWGETWGDKGYILMSRNRDNNCGIATKPSYPIV